MIVWFGDSFPPIFLQIRVGNEKFRLVIDWFQLNLGIHCIKTNVLQRILIIHNLTK